MYTWDAANRLVSVDVGGVVSTLAYNGLGQRTSQTVDGVTTDHSGRNPAREQVHFM